MLRTEQHPFTDRLQLSVLTLLGLVRGAEQLSEFPSSPSIFEWRTVLPWYVQSGRL